MNNKPTTVNFGHSNFYLIGTEIIAKEFKKEYAYNAEHDFVMGKFLLSKGINVPKMIGIIYNGISEDHVYLLMENIEDGVSIGDLEIEERKILARRYRDEMQKAKKLDVIPNDTDIFGSIYSRKKDKVYLCDFEEWRFK